MQQLCAVCASAKSRGFRRGRRRGARCHAGKTAHAGVGCVVDALWRAVGGSIPAGEAARQDGGMMFIAAKAGPKRACSRAAICPYSFQLQCGSTRVNPGVQRCSHSRAANPLAHVVAAPSATGEGGERCGSGAVGSRSVSLVCRAGGTHMEAGVKSVVPGGQSGRWLRLLPPEEGAPARPAPRAVRPGL